ncbi:MAG: DUF2237 domain-containing protein [Paraglaciecola sp.]|uniref:DUF2237 family protein n=1 Tax=Pseudomonadati TaxID=3379134 RepID=UPI00273FF990|nr:DUF2237 domain-containing protein [Paraglaciecola sp.]MDP5029257.1 DUF2237 domain-containing protein [Paraglaciecola sp.]MDP5040198.1 DUF2237 domain-containing protein [Paraglaciecola sp.]MDP5129517.1 DUF2237 domain-containing protein [Paraglaciecola sp.]
MANEKNVLGGPLKLCCGNGGFTREGFCYVPASDHGNHSVCAIMTDDFLLFSKSRGNDLSTPIPQYQFAGLKAGDKWCLCAARWQEAFNAGKAPQVILSATNQACLNTVKLADLQAHGVIETN